MTIFAKYCKPCETERRLMDNLRIFSANSKRISVVIFSCVARRTTSFGYLSIIAFWNVMTNQLDINHFILPHHSHRTWLRFSWLIIPDINSLAKPRMPAFIFCESSSIFILSNPIIIKKTSLDFALIFFLKTVLFTLLPLKPSTHKSAIDVSIHDISWTFSLSTKNVNTYRNSSKMS